MRVKIDSAVNWRALCYDWLYGEVWLPQFGD